MFEEVEARLIRKVLEWRRGSWDCHLLKRDLVRVNWPLEGPKFESSPHGMGQTWSQFPCGRPGGKPSMP